MGAAVSGGLLRDLVCIYSLSTLFVVGVTTFQETTIDVLTISHCFAAAAYIHSFICSFVLIIETKHRCGPCLLMAPEFEAAAQTLKDKVRFVKIDTDKEESMAARLNIMGLPTLLFLDKYEPADGEEVQEGAKAVLKGRIEGALRKENILDLCEHHFFEGPAPQL
jgi:thiol-disulfide isomerase/thioredoxin